LPAHPLAVPPSPFFAGASPRRATIAYLGWRIPLPCLHRLSWSAHPIAAPPYRISLHARKQKRVSVSAIIENHGFISSPHLHRLSRFAIWPARSARLPRRDESPPLGWCTRS
jgi:hypothetical protein